MDLPRRLQATCEPLPPLGIAQSPLRSRPPGLTLADLPDLTGQEES